MNHLLLKRAPNKINETSNKQFWIKESYFDSHRKFVITRYIEWDDTIVFILIKNKKNIHEKFSVKNKTQILHRPMIHSVNSFEPSFLAMLMFMVSGPYSQFLLDFPAF